MANPSGDELALLKAIVSRPDDDLPRMVYADWLEERGRTERAEFIRLQVGEHSAESWALRAECKERANDLLEVHQGEWFRELPRWVRQWYTARRWEQPTFCRGFVCELSVFASAFFDFGDRLLDRTPLVSLDLYHLRALRRKLARCRWLGRVPLLNLGYECLEVDGAAALAANRDLHGVRELKLPGCQLGDAGVRALADAKSLTGLRSLDLADNGLTLAAVKALRGASFLGGLTWLNLTRNPQLLGYEHRIHSWLGQQVPLDV